MRIILLSGNVTVAQFDHVRQCPPPKIVRYLGEIYSLSHPLTEPGEPGERGRNIIGFHYQLERVQDLRAADNCRPNDKVFA